MARVGYGVGAASCSTVKGDVKGKWKILRNRDKRAYTGG
jgi:hypothetical protein